MDPKKYEDMNMEDFLSALESEDEIMRKMVLEERKEERVPRYVASYEA